MDPFICKTFCSFRWAKKNVSFCTFKSEQCWCAINTYRLETGGGLAERPLRGILLILFVLSWFRKR